MSVTASRYASNYGHVIERPGDIFVNGLFVTHLDGYRFGYSLLPKFLKIDRDRRMVADFDLQWITSQIWSKCEEHDLVLDMIGKECPDVKYLNSFLYNTDRGLADQAAEAFIGEHGKEAIPVSSQMDITVAQDQGHEKVVLMPKTQQELITRSSFYSYPPSKIVRKTPRELLLDFMLKYKDTYFSQEMLDDYEDLLKKAEGWYS